MKEKDLTAIFSSNSDEWSTPDDLYERLNAKYNFVLDAAASIENTKCEHFYSLENNALKRPWNVSNGWVWCNPPYSQCSAFLKKAYEEMLLGTKIIMLVPSRTDVKWFHNYVHNKEGVDYQFIKGRLRFSNSKNSAPFPSMLVRFDLGRDKIL